MFFIGFPREDVLGIINSSIYNIILWSFILAAIGTILYNILTKINIVRPLHVMQDYLTQIAAGDFTKEINPKYLHRRDEFGEIANAAKDMCNSLKSMILNIKEKSSQVSAGSQELAAASEEMSASSNELAATMQHVADGSVKQANDLEIVVNLLSGLTDNIENANKELQKLKDESENVENNAEIGRREMDILVESIEKIEKAFNQRKLL